jgi:hypothetical protein
MATAASTFGAALIGLPLYAFKRAVSFSVIRVDLLLTQSARFPPIACHPSAIVGLPSSPHFQYCIPDARHENETV